MLMTVDDLRRYMASEEEDQVLADRLQALELQIRGYTNNDFTVQHTGRLATIENGVITLNAAADYAPGDTVQLSGVRNNGLYTIVTATETALTVKEEVFDDFYSYAAKVKYPMDVKLGAVNLLKWESANRDKAGVASESISRHSVTYADQTEENTVLGYPVMLTGFLKPYMKARFGRGVDL